MHTDYAPILGQQAPLLEALLIALRQEQDLLLRGEVDGPGLEAVANHKRDCLSQLQVLEDQRQSSLQAMGLTASAMDQEEAASQQDCLLLWETVQSTTRQTQHLNQLNGVLIEKRLQHNQRVLHTLRELTSAPVYDADGQSRRGSSLRTSA